jgi:protein-L-isoaspartate(D-aspartate) O-methyltransferase
MPERDAFYKARQRMVEDQIGRRGVSDARVLEAIRALPRHLFIDPEYHDEAYADHPLPIGDGQTISQPYIVALMTACLGLKGDEKVLEIGTGSGYQAGLLGRLAREVHTVELVSRLAVKARSILEGLGINNVHVHVGDGSLGWPEEAPYDRIITTAAAPRVPDAYLEQLKPDGKMVIPVGARWRQMLELWTRQGDEPVKEEILPVVFVPLLGAEGWQDFGNP